MFFVTEQLAKLRNEKIQVPDYLFSYMYFLEFCAKVMGKFLEFVPLHGDTPVQTVC